jgi:hypothetical protein
MCRASASSVRDVSCPVLEKSCCSMCPSQLQSFRPAKRGAIPLSTSESQKWINYRLDPKGRKWEVKSNMPTLLTTIASGLLIAVITSLLTVRLALWRFHSEKWWERKAELYSNLIEALYDMRCYSHEWLDNYDIDPESDRPAEAEKRKDRLDELLSRHNKAEEEVEKIAIIGAFIVSDAVAADLTVLRAKNQAAMSMFHEIDIREVAEACMKSVEECLGRVREHAKEDLGIKRKLPPLLERFASPVLSAAMKTGGMR